MVESIRTETPEEFFQQLVRETQSERGIESSDASSDYLVQLLAVFIRPQGLYGNLSTRPQYTLGELLLLAIQAEGGERLALLQTTGDLALFLSGFFAESLGRRRVRLAYYRDLGVTAYHQAATCATRVEAPPYAELAENFAPFTDVLQGVSERCSLCEETHLLRVYQRYLETGDGRDRDLLHRRGIVTHDTTSRVN